MRPLNKLRLAILVPWKEAGRWELPHQLRRHLESVEILHPVLPAGSRQGRWVDLSLRASEFYLPLTALTRRHEFDLILSWTMRIGILLGLINRLFRKAPKCRHILCDFHVDPMRSDRTYRLRLKMLKAALPGIDYFFCTSRPERAIYHERFGIPLEAIDFFPLAPASHLFGHAAAGDGDYLFSYGNSDRDFDTLVRAASSLGLKLVLLSQQYRPKSDLPPTVSLIDRKVPYGELLRWIRSARIVVLPLRSSMVSAGQMAMMEVMALGAPLVISRNMATQEYASHGNTALFFESGDGDDLKEQLRYLLRYPETAREMGRSAREAAKRFAPRQLEALIEGLTRAHSVKPCRR